MAWGFGDGASGSDPLLPHAYARPGTFPVTLQMQDALGNATSRAAQVVVSAPAPAPPGGGGPTGTRPPSFTVGTLRARVARRTLLRQGLTVRLTAAAPTAFAIELRARFRGAKLASTGDLIIAERRLPAATGTRTARLKVSRALRRLVRRGARLRVQITATGADGSTTTVLKRVRVRK